MGGSVVHTGQLFFDETTNPAVYTKAPYAGRSGQRTLNAQDGIYSNGGARSIVPLTVDGDGYAGRLTIGVRV